MFLPTIDKGKNIARATRLIKKRGRRRRIGKDVWHAIPNEYTLGIMFATAERASTTVRNLPKLPACPERTTLKSAPGEDSWLASFHAGKSGPAIPNAAPSMKMGVTERMKAAYTEKKSFLTLTLRFTYKLTSEAIVDQDNMYPATIHPRPRTPFEVVLGEFPGICSPLLPEPANAVRRMKQIRVGNQRIDSTKCITRIPKKHTTKETIASMTIPTMDDIDSFGDTAFSACPPRIEFSMQ